MQLITIVLLSFYGQQEAYDLHALLPHM